MTDDWMKCPQCGKNLTVQYVDHGKTVYLCQPCEKAKMEKFGAMFPKLERTVNGTTLSCKNTCEQPAPSPSETIEKMREFITVQQNKVRYAQNAATEAGLELVSLRQRAESLERENATLRQVVGELAKELSLANVTIHCGQYHQWNKVEDCDEAPCRNRLALIRRAAEAIKP